VQLVFQQQIIILMHAAGKRIFNRHNRRRDFAVMDSREGFAKGSARNCDNCLRVKKFFCRAFAIRTGLALKCNAL